MKTEAPLLTEKTILLKRGPIKIAGVETDRLTMRRPTTLDVLVSLKVPGGTLCENAALYANLCMVTPGDMEEVDYSDFKKLEAAFDELSAFEAIKDYVPGDEIPLTVPITTKDGKRLESIKMRRPKVKDMKKANAEDRTTAEQDCVLYAELTELTLQEIKALDWADMQKIKGVYQGFLQ